MREFLLGMTDVGAGEAIAEAFRSKYEHTKMSGSTPDEIFAILWEFAGADHFTKPPQIAAVAAVVSYFFSTCDIFENTPPNGGEAL